MPDKFDASTRILVVDDMATLRSLTVGFLVELGFYDIIEAGDGNEAWEKISNSEPRVQLVLADLNMPNSSGLDLLKMVRGDARFAALPFIMITTESEAHMVMAAAQLKVTNYIVKPLTPTTLSVKLSQTYRRVAGFK